MALSIPQSEFPMPDAPLTVFVPIIVGGKRVAYFEGGAEQEGLQMLNDEARKEGVALTGKPKFKYVTVEPSGDLFLMGEQEYSVL